MKLLFVYIVTLCSTIQLYTDGVFIIVHGTWALHNSWYRPGGDFFDALEKTAIKYNYKVISFAWSGKLHHSCRMCAAQMLVKLIQSYPITTEIKLVTHSHGGNVAIIASQLMAADQNNRHKIQAMFGLGTPVNTHEYMPNMGIIKKLYNFFSFEDAVQPILGFFKREFPQHPSIANIRVFINNKEPGHKGLLSSFIAHWLPMFHEELAILKIGNFHHFDMAKPGIINITKSESIDYLIEMTREQSQEKDFYATTMIAQSLVKKKKRK